MRVAVFFVVALFLSGSAFAWQQEATEAAAAPETVMDVRYEGETDYDMLKQVRSDLERAQAKDSKIKVFRVHVMSPGGPVLTSLEIARMLRDASDAGLTVEIHAVGMCASGCTFLLASGTPGQRYISKYALFLVHPPQRGGMFEGPTCVKHVDKPKTQDDKVTDAILDLMADAYMRYTNHDRATVEGWITCGDERVGNGTLAVTLAIADKAE
jgi:ATP-dependent protease ClpP protease subunit